MLKQMIYSVLTYGVSVIIASGLFVGLFHTKLFSGITVFFYRGVFFLFIASLAAAIITFIIKNCFTSFGLDMKDVFISFVLFFGFTLGWYTLVPVTVERSISVYMLSYMDQNNKPVTEEDFEKIFFNNYITKYGAFRKRFKEQLLSGNIKQVDDGFVITENGRRVVNLFRGSASLFNTEKWLVYPNNYGFGEKNKDTTAPNNK